MKTLIATLIFTMAAPAYADDCPRALDYKAGAIIECDGTLVPRAQLLWLLDSETEARRANAELAVQAGRYRTLVEAFDRNEAAWLDERATLRRLHAEAEAAAQERKWYESPWFWLGAGLALGAAGGYLVAR